MPEGGFHNSILSGMGLPSIAEDVGARLSDRDVGLPRVVDDRLAQIIAHLQRQMRLEKLAIFVREYESDNVVSRLPLHAHVMLTLHLNDSVESQQEPLSSIIVPLGVLGTDHVGYASFDLRRTQSAESLLALANVVGKEVEIDNLKVDMQIQVLPFGEALFAIDALSVGEIAAAYVVVRHHLEEGWLIGRSTDLPLPSLQYPDILDWHLSPGSFALAPTHLIGESGCEQLYPSNLSSDQFHFHQAVRRIDASKDTDDRFLPTIRYGYILEYRSQWFPIGHSLGQVRYSLPLAPGEKVNLAIIDWSRTDSAGRSERTGLRETLTHDLQRDRGVSEIVFATVREKQSGSSFMGGLGASVLVPMGSVLLGGSLGLGGATTDSRGTRKISANTTQQLSDGFHQTSSALRELRSTVITQASQVESGRFETRTIANHNHCHTLTILYYEVLRHYRVVTSLVRRRPVLFVDFSGFPPATINENFVLSRRLALEAALLDLRYLDAFDALERKRAAQLALADATARFNNTEHPVSAAELTFTTMYLFFETGDEGSNGEFFFEIILQNGQTVRTRQLSPPLPTDANDFELDTTRDDFVKNTVDGFLVVPEHSVRWGDIRGFVVRHRRTSSQLANGDDETWALDGLRVIGQTVNHDTALLLDEQPNIELTNEQDTTEIEVRQPAQDAVTLSPPQLTDFISSADLARVDALLAHLVAFGMYYTAATLVSSDPVGRGERFRTLNVRGNISLFDVVENQVVAAMGRELAFPLTEVGDTVIRDEFGLREADDPAADLIASEDLVSLPTRGVFAEGKLGYCSTCEPIDNSRFWDFQSSPIPGEAPEIGTLDTSSRFQAPGGLTPSEFPSGIVNIVNPPAAPDPVALGAALQVLGSGNLFRDMSGSAGLASFLSSIVQGTTSAVSALAGSRRESELIDQIQNIDDLTPEQKASLIGQLLSGGQSSDEQSNGDGGGGLGSGATGDPSEGSPEAGPTGGGQSTGTPAGGSPDAGPTGGSQSTGTRSRSRKPARPEPGPTPGKQYIIVDFDLNGLADPSQTSASAQVQPAGGEIIQFGPIHLGSQFVQIELPDDSVKAGSLRVRLTWAWRKEIIRSKLERVFDVFGFNDDEERKLTAVGGDINVYQTANYTIPADQKIIQFEATPETSTIKVNEKTAYAAEIKAQAEFGADFKIVKVAANISGSVSESGETEIEYIVTAVHPRLMLTHVK